MPAQAAAKLDLNSLGEKTRVFTLAKLLGVTSKQLVIELDAVGIVKVAQSSLTKQEVERVVKALSSKDDTSTDTPADDDRIRRRVESNVRNEINQIEQKVEQQLAEAVDASDAEANGAAENDAAEEDEEEETTGDEMTLPEPSAPEQPAAPPQPLFMAPTEPVEPAAEVSDEADNDAFEGRHNDRRARRRRRTRRAGGTSKDSREHAQSENDAGHSDADTDDGASPRRRGRRFSRTRGTQSAVAERQPIEEPLAIKGSTRLEARRRRRTKRREAMKNEPQHVVTEEEVAARREAVERVMVIREKKSEERAGRITQVAVLENERLVEHFVTSDNQASMVGNIYLGRVQNVLPAMEAAFVDIGKGRNGALYAGELDWRSAGRAGRRHAIEQVLHTGDQILVQVIKDPVGHKGARLSTRISLAGRYLVLVPNGRSGGISRKLADTERQRLKNILRDIMPEEGGAIVRTAAEGVAKDSIAADVQRLSQRWEQIDKKVSKEKSSKGSRPITLYEEPDMLVKVIRDIFNEDFSRLVVDGERAWNTVHAYIQSVAPELEDRMERYDRKANGDADAFETYGVDEQLSTGLSRTVYLPSGGSLVIDRTEAMTVIDVNTGKFTGDGGNLEETVTLNNLEAVEEIVRQMRLRDIGGMIVVDFIDMVLPQNQDLVLRRLKEALARDRSRHQLSEVTSLGLVQMTRKKLGVGLIETFATTCEQCEGRGIIIHTDPVAVNEQTAYKNERRRPTDRDRAHNPTQHPAALAMHRDAEESEHAATSSKSIEELADAVIADVDGQRSGDSNGSRRHSRRSQRRGGSVQADADRIGKVAEAAVAEANARDPEEPSGADHVAEDNPATTYEEALEAFNSSPRRRRKTRGNSRSDHAPTPEDFGLTSAGATGEVGSEQDVAVHRPAAPTEQPADHESNDAESNDADASSDSSRRGRRGRRRTRRTTSTSVAARRGDAAGNDTDSSDKEKFRTALRSTGSGSQEEDTVQERGTRRERQGRRRAVRRTSHNRKDEKQQQPRRGASQGTADRAANTNQEATGGAAARRGRHSRRARVSRPSGHRS